LGLAAQAGRRFAYEWDAGAGVRLLCGDCTNILGVGDPASLTLQQLLSKVHPADCERLTAAISQLTPDEPDAQVSFRITHPERGEISVETNTRAFFDKERNMVRLVGIVADVTPGTLQPRQPAVADDRLRLSIESGQPAAWDWHPKSATEALRRKDIELAEAQRLARVGSWQWEVATDTVVWSEELYRIAGRDCKLPAPNYREHAGLYTAESWERLRRAVEEALRSGAPYELELEMVRTDGTTRWLIARGEAQRDAGGRITGLRGTVQDITERRRAEEVLRESEARLRLAAQAGGMYAFEWDRASDVVTRSSDFKDPPAMAIPPKRTTWKQMLSTVHPDDRPKIVDAVARCTPENHTCRIQYRVLSPDGSVIWSEMNARAFFDAEGRMLRMIGMVSDITEKKLAAEALSTLSRKLIEAQETERARIARDLHDDISQRLALLSLTLEQMRGAAAVAGPVIRTYMDELRRQVLDVSRSVHALSHDLHSSRLSHLGVVNAMRSLCAELSEQQKVEIDFICIHVPRRVAHDISLCLFRVLQEALHNAVKHSLACRFEVELRGTSDAIHLTIRDPGIGFDPEAAVKSGGLGLTSMRERLKLVRGELSIESQPGHGTRIHARVPLRGRSAAPREAVQSSDE
jgi:signal transduction histidine kinase